MNYFFSLLEKKQHILHEKKATLIRGQKSRNPFSFSNQKFQGPVPFKIWLYISIRLYFSRLMESFFSPLDPDEESQKKMKNKREKKNSDIHSVEETSPFLIRQASKSK